ncbi:aldo/keto reductase [Phyllobacterium sp. 0TCS1.6A]|uniref:aldo/keto reductase n=1 Tax=Phyllobacterium sp. 0TCS1.6A TaxID=2995637 RepID=UPI0022644F55|nr:aldo/keto reductase [Phyllobacterium sp. 0TCS1.6A]MCX8293217.1 aldo/keto reductase [Phyllobacterium sp. 0TCS1.6A]
MKQRKLGRTGLEVTEICLGTMTWGVQNTEADAHEQIDYALDAGINFMDTAEVYAIPSSPDTYGKTETYIGSWFKKTGKRDKFILASKISGGGTNWIREGRRPDRQSVREAVEGSLKRLQTDYIDLYQVHYASRGHYHFGTAWKYAPENQDTADVLDNIADTLQGLDDMVREGKIRHVGLSNETAWGIGQWLKLAEQGGLPRVASVQNEYSLIQRVFDLDLAELSHHEDVGLLAYSSLASGVLTGKYLGGQVPPGTRATVQPGGLWRNNDYSAPAVQAYIDLAARHGLDIAQMAIAFALSRPFMTAVIIGATTMEQLKTDIAAADLTLSDEVISEINAIYRAYPRPL